jgi:hypothetical protein
MKGVAKSCLSFVDRRHAQIAEEQGEQYAQIGPSGHQPHQPYISSRERTAQRRAAVPDWV